MIDVTAVLANSYHVCLSFQELGVKNCFITIFLILTANTPLFASFNWHSGNHAVSTALDDNGHLWNDAIVNFYDDAIVDTITVANDAALNLNAGALVKYILQTFDNGTANLLSGSVVNGSLGASGSSTINIYGDVEVGQNLQPRYDGVINVYGYSFSVDGGKTYLADGTRLSAVVPLVEDGTTDYYSGTLERKSEPGGTVFTNSFLIRNSGFYDNGTPDQSADIIVHVIPEPATMALLAIGGVATLRRRRSR